MSSGEALVESFLIELRTSVSEVSTKIGFGDFEGDSALSLPIGA